MTWWAIRDDGQLKIDIFRLLFRPPLPPRNHIKMHHCGTHFSIVPKRSSTTRTRSKLSSPSFLPAITCFTSLQTAWLGLKRGRRTSSQAIIQNLRTKENWQQWSYRLICGWSHTALQRIRKPLNVRVVGRSTFEVVTTAAPERACVLRWWPMKCINCDEEYIGETGRTASTWVKEHAAYIRNGRVPYVSCCQNMPFSKIISLISAMLRLLIMSATSSSEQRKKHFTSWSMSKRIYLEQGQRTGTESNLGQLIFVAYSLSAFSKSRTPHYSARFLVIRWHSIHTSRDQTPRFLAHSLVTH